MNVHEIVYGLGDIDNIVACEYKDDLLHIFEEKDGIGSTKVLPLPYFLIGTDTPRTEGWNRLEGKLPFKWFKTYTTKDDLLQDKLIHRDSRFLNIYDDREGAMLLGGFTFFRGMHPEDVSVLSFDIESTGVTHDNESRVLLITNTLQKNDGSKVRRIFAYDDYQSDKEMIDAWTEWVRMMNPSVITGHNIYMFDLPYLQFCAERAGTTLALGRDSSPIQFNSFESKFRRDGSQFYTYHGANIFGRQIVDTFFLAIKYDIARKYESYALKKIIAQEGLEVEGRQHYDAGKIRENYLIPTEWNLIKRYAEQDADDALAIYNLMVPAFFYLTQSVPKPFQTIMTGASGSQINSILIRSYLASNHSIPAPSAVEPFEGAISIGNPGIYENVYKIDVASLYPNIMLQYKITNSYKDPLGYFLSMLEFLTAERLNNKKLARETGERRYKDLESAQKIIINSVYGMMGAPGINFNSPEHAAQVTRIGREILNTAIQYTQSNQIQIVNADTDSISVTKGDLFTNPEARQSFLDVINSLFPKNIRWEDDGFYPAALVVKAKNYVLDRPGRRTIKGSALKATMKESALRDFLNEVLGALLHKQSDEVASIYLRYAREIKYLIDITRWAHKKTITEAVLAPERTNEQKVLEALTGTEFAQGDKRFFYFKDDDSLALVDTWRPNAPNHNADRLYEKLYKTLKILETVYKVDTCVNFKLKKNKKLLAQL